jgi:hypothetical protein
MTTSGVGGTTPISMQNIQSMDIETALMMVQSERTKLLDAQLKTQIEEVQNRNNLVAKLNDALNGLNTVAGGVKGANADSKAENATDAQINAANQALKDAGITDITVSKSSKKSDIETAITKVKSQIDAAGNSQQMDMLRLQSMSNKRNEAFDVMTNFVKKMQESRSSIIGNMR